ncbi:MAG: S1/P1 nuclease [Geminicoccaceae bacterium]
MDATHGDRINVDHLGAVGQGLGCSSPIQQEDDEGNEAGHAALLLTAPDSRSTGSAHPAATPTTEAHHESCWSRAARSATPSPSDPAAAAAQLEQEITTTDRAQWTASGPVEWANESFAISPAAATGYCVQADGVCRYTADNVALDPGEDERLVRIDAAYVAASTPLVRDRLKRAGVRLATCSTRRSGTNPTPQRTSCPWAETGCST